MSEQPIFHLSDRVVVHLSGADAESLLQRLITIDMDDLQEGELRHGALLTPQGKIALDFLLSRKGQLFRFDLDRELLAAFTKKMTLYRMRSDVTIAESDERVGVAFSLPADQQAVAMRDIRSDLLGWRLYGKGEAWQVSSEGEQDYLARHLDAIIPQAGLDFALEDAFPHDINMDFLGGLDFAKGCYVGQEVVSRMHHRGTARKRLVRIEADTTLPESGTSIMAGGKPVGAIGAVLDKRALAIVRLDRVADALKEGLSLTAGDTPLRVILPDYADFTLDL
ncbi:folate-binding protein [uncultured Cohaesibacter sp.]|uniref:CAF17-like 4Fe-4S cluster assembly/insertion protein YgfZ n=1 Tax=uncultured Cohaesibacter sp. TaxID=1002546 RepID=UPI0029C7955F|nr:folate-binding protein [uncultured Cohaesibacter sp.]